MITEKDLQEAIAECEGQRNPTANTCIKLAAFYTIKQHLFPEINQYGQSFSPDPKQITDQSQDTTIWYDGDSDFSKLVNGIDMQDFMEIMDDLMETLTVVNPKLYNGIMQKLSEV